MKRTNFTKRIISLIVIICLALSLSGCDLLSSNDQVTDSVRGFLNAVKEDDVVSAKSHLLYADDYGTLTTIAKNVGLDQQKMDNFLNRYTDIEFTIESDKQTDDTNVRVVFVNLVVPDYSQSFSEYLQSFDPTLSDEENLKLMMETLAGSTPTQVNKAVAVTVTKQGDQWLIDSREKNFELYNAISGNLLQSLQSYTGV